MRAMPRALIVPVLPLMLGSAFLVAGCAKLLNKEKGEAKPEAGAAAPVAAASAAVDAAPPSSCAGEAPQRIAAGANLATGITLTRLPDGQLALGYASFDGTPKAVIIDGSGKSRAVETDTAHLKDKEKKEDTKTVRTVNRVTPLGFRNGKMRVGVDLLDKNADGSRQLRCGAADEEPITAFKGFSVNGDLPDGGIPKGKEPSDPIETRDCRTFSNGQMHWVLASEVDPKGGSPEMLWSIDTKPGKAHVEGSTVDHVAIKAAANGKKNVDAFAFELPVSASVSSGYVLVSRRQGSLVVATRRGDLSPAAEPIAFQLGAPVGLPAVAAHGGNAALLVTVAGKPDLFGSTFPIDGKPRKPEKLDLQDASPPTEGDRSSVSVAARPNGDFYVVFADGKYGKKRGRIVILDGQLRPRAPIADVDLGEQNQAELRVQTLPDGRAFVAYLEAGEGGAFNVMSTVLKCKTDR